MNRQVDSEEEGDPIYYDGDNDEDGQPTIRLIEVEVSEEKEQRNQDIDEEKSEQSIIKIDEGSEIMVSKRRKGFQSNLYFIKEYCIALCQYVRDNYGINFKKSIGNSL